MSIIINLTKFTEKNSNIYHVREINYKSVFHNVSAETHFIC